MLMLQTIVKQLQCNQERLISNLTETVRTVLSTFESRDMDADKWEQKLTAVTQKKERLLDLYLGGELSKSEYHRMSERYDTEMENLQQQLQKANKRKSIQANQKELLADISDPIRGLMLGEKQDDTFYRNLVDRIVVYSRERIDTNFSQEEVMDVFERLDFDPEIQDGVISVVIPSYRTDMEGMADLSEEVIRLIGYDRLPSTLPFMPMTEGKLDEQQRMIRTTENVLSSLGLEQCITYTLISTLKKDNAILSNDEAIELAMPMSEERRWIRTSILPSLLGVVAYNQARKLSSVNVFEISDVEGRCQQRKHLAICLSGPLEMTPWLHEETPADFYTLKGLLETLFDSLGINRARIHFTENKDEGHFHPFRSACIKMGKETLGYMGEIHPKYAKENDVKNVYMAELDLSSLMETKKSKIKFTPISKYPTVTRDLALIVDRELPAENIVQLIEKHGRDQKTKEKIVKEIEIFDVYEGEHVKENEKSIAIRIVFGSDTHTLKDEEINNVFETMLESLKRDLNAQLRG